MSLPSSAIKAYPRKKKKVRKDSLNNSIVSIERYTHDSIDKKQDSPVEEKRKGAWKLPISTETIFLLLLILVIAGTFYWYYSSQHTFIMNEIQKVKLDALTDEDVHEIIDQKISDSIQTQPPDKND